MEVMADISTQTVGFFTGLTLAQRQTLLPLVRQCTYSAGEVIVRVNQPATNFFIIESGEVEIGFQPYDGAPMKLDPLTSGDMFGWSAVLGRDVYTASVRALTDSVIFAIASQKIAQLCVRDHETGMVLLEKMAASIRQHPTQPVDLVMELINRAMRCDRET